MPVATGSVGEDGGAAGAIGSQRSEIALVAAGASACAGSVVEAAAMTAGGVVVCCASLIGAAGTVGAGGTTGVVSRAASAIGALLMRGAST